MRGDLLIKRTIFSSSQTSLFYKFTIIINRRTRNLECSLLNALFLHLGPSWPPQPASTAIVMAWCWRSNSLSWLQSYTIDQSNSIPCPSLTTSANAKQKIQVVWDQEIASAKIEKRPGGTATRAFRLKPIHSLPSLSVFTAHNTVWWSSIIDVAVFVVVVVFRASAVSGRVQLGVTFRADTNHFDVGRQVGGQTFG